MTSTEDTLSVGLLIRGAQVADFISFFQVEPQNSECSYIPCLLQNLGSTVGCRSVGSYQDILPIFIHLSMRTEKYAKRKTTQ